ncbi:hypothetical protein SUGI_0738320 [Cryptomeria japonica]|nr:hypothetical protein SUGI_0738320 [Cryptomeria japonica]
MALFSFAEAPPLTIGFSVLIVAFLWWVLKRRNVVDAKGLLLPPGPSPWLVIGNLHQLGDLPHRSLAELSKKYGALMFMRLGSIPALVVSSSQMAKQILTTHDLAFGNRPATASAKYVAYGEIDPGLAPYGPYWRHMRKISVMQLLSAKRVDSFASLREEEVATGVRSIWEKSRHGKLPVNLTAAISSIISDQHVERNAKVDGEKEHVKDLVDVLLDIEKEEPDGENGIKVGREHIKATIFDMFLGGIETTIITLEWTMSELLRNPQIAKKLQQEIQSKVGKHRMVKESDLANMERGCPGAYLATQNINLVLAQLLHCFDWKLEGNADPSCLDMTETFRTSIPRKVSLFAVPSLKLDIEL